MERLTHTATICGMLLCGAACQHEGPSAESSEKATVVDSETATPELPREPVSAQPAVAVGDESPDFELQDQHGQQRTLAEFLGEAGKGKVALVFYRSADW